MRYILLDTDIGSDVDDALALAVLLGSPDATIVGIATVYGDTTLRAQIAAHLIGLSEPNYVIPVMPGTSHPLSARPVWWTGHEGAGLNNLNLEVVGDQESGVQLILDVAERYPGQLEILAIGPLTNIAEALRRRPAIADQIKRLYAMGGDFRPVNRAPEHNFKCDSVAARDVLSSAIPISIVGLEITQQVKLAADDVAHVAQAGALGAALQVQIETWWKFHGNAWNNPHDPIAALLLLLPHLFDTRDMTVTVIAEPGDRDGLCVDDASGRPITVVTDLDKASVKREIVSRIAAAAQSSSPPG